jgi:hypothetical protein
MPRCGRLRTFIREYEESHRIERMSFIPPFFILALEIILIVHAVIVQEMFVIMLTSILVAISIIELLLVAFEIHEHYMSSNFDRILTIKLDDFIIEKKITNVKIIVSDFLSQHPEYEVHRNEIYRITCQVLETHREEKIEKEITDKLKKFIKRKKKATVLDIVKGFVKKYPKLKKYRQEVYEKTCLLLESKSK